MSLDMYCGAQATFEFTVDDPTTVGVDDLSAVEWMFRIEGADEGVVEIEGTYAQPTVSVTVDAATSAGVAPGLYRAFVVALQTGQDEIVATEDVLRVKTYPQAPPDTVS